MKIKKAVRYLAVVLAFLVGVSAAPLLEGKNTISYAVSSRLDAPERVKAVSANRHAVKLSWKKVKHAKGYFVYRYDRNKKKYKKVKTLSAKKRSWINRGLKTDRVYRYKVRAYQKVKGKKRAGKISYVVTAKPQTKKSKKKNIKDVSIINLEGLYPGYQTRMPRDIKPWRNIVSKKLVWKSSNPKIVKVSKRGIVTAVKTGSAVITARAHNGVQAKGKVTVVNYSATIDGKTVSLGEPISSLNEKFHCIYTGTPADDPAARHISEFGYADGNIKVHYYGKSEKELAVIEGKGRVLGFSVAEPANFDYLGVKPGDKKGAEVERKLATQWGVEYTDYSDEPNGEAFYEGFSTNYVGTLRVDVTGGYVKGVSLGENQFLAASAHTLITEENPFAFL